LTRNPFALSRCHGGFPIDTHGDFTSNKDSMPLRVVIDGKNQITDTTLKIFSNAANTKIFNSGNTQRNNAGKLDLHHVLEQLAQQNINSVLLESGPKLIGAMVEAGLVGY
jgi:diaminohydroxyphosphoribosylaminopyrimidine deaminase/5-amino-6-(5-phosphoribosylamino)uracil reductase